MAITTISFLAPQYDEGFFDGHAFYQEPVDTLPVLGKGGYGTVYRKTLSLDHTKKTFTDIAVKVSDVSNAYYLKRANDEISILKRLKDVSNVPKIFRSYAYGNVISFSMNFIPGEPLTNFIKDPAYFPVTKVLGISKQILTILNDLGNLGIIHGDLSARNVLYDGTQVTLIDFGLSTELTRVQSNDHLFCSVDERAPEVYLGAIVYDNSPDIYSLGLLVYKLFTKQRLLFPGSQEKLSTYNNSLLALSRINGPAPLSFLSRGRHSYHFFFPNSNTFINNKFSAPDANVYLNDKFSQATYNRKRLDLILDVSINNNKEPVDQPIFLLNLVASMIQWDPIDRPTPTDLIDRITVFEQDLT